MTLRAVRLTLREAIAFFNIVFSRSSRLILASGSRIFCCSDVKRLVLRRDVLEVDPTPRQLSAENGTSLLIHRTSLHDEDSPKSVSGTGSPLQTAPYRMAVG